MPRLFDKSARSIIPLTARRALTSTAAFAALICANGHATIPSELAKSVVYLTIDGAQAQGREREFETCETRHGTGFLIDREAGIILTARHLMMDWGRGCAGESVDKNTVLAGLRIKAQFGARPSGATELDALPFPDFIRFISDNPDFDGALLQLSPPDDAVALPLCREEKPDQEFPIEAFGYPRGEPQMKGYPGSKHQTSRDERWDLRLSDLEFGDGVSGGPILNSDLQVVAMLIGARRDDPRTIVGVPIRYLENLTDQAAVPVSPCQSNALWRSVFKTDQTAPPIDDADYVAGRTAIFFSSGTGEVIIGRDRYKFVLLGRLAEGGQVLFSVEPNSISRIASLKQKNGQMLDPKSMSPLFSQAMVNASMEPSDIKVGEQERFLVLNAFGYFAVIEIEEIGRTEGPVSRDYVKFSYWVSKNKYSADFSNLPEIPKLVKVNTTSEEPVSDVAAVTPD